MSVTQGYFPFPLPRLLAPGVFPIPPAPSPCSCCLVLPCHHVPCARRGVEPYDKPSTVYIERHEPSGTSTVIRSTDFFQSRENKEIILEDVQDFQLRDKYMFATKSVVSDVSEGFSAEGGCGAEPQRAGASLLHLTAFRARWPVTEVSPSPPAAATPCGLTAVAAYAALPVVFPCPCLGQAGQK